MIYLLIIYFIFLLFFALYSFVAIYHLKRYDNGDKIIKRALAFYVVASILVVLTTIALISTREWPQDFNFEKDNANYYL